HPVHVEQALGALSGWPLEGGADAVEPAGEVLGDLALRDDAVLDRRLEAHRLEGALEPGVGGYPCSHRAGTIAQALTIVFHISTAWRPHSAVFGRMHARKAPNRD